MYLFVVCVYRVCMCFVNLIMYLV